MGYYKDLDLKEVLNVAKELGFKVDVNSLKENLKDFEEWFKEAREIRRKSADWDFINRQPEPIRSALIVLVETGDLKLACKLADLKLGDFNEIRLKAKIPIVL